MKPQQPIIGTTATGGGVSFSREERERHLYIVGKSGSGKSTVLFNLAMADIEAGEGVAVIDPHGDLAEAIIDSIPPERTNQVCYLNVADMECPVGFNPLAGITPDRRALAAAGIVSAFKHLWRDSWGPRMEHFLFHGVAALLEAPRPTLLDLSRMYTEPKFRERVVARITDPAVAGFWRHEFPSYDQRFQAEAASPILNKVGQIAASPILRGILGQHSPKFDLAHAMDHGGIFVANLAEPAVEAGGILIANLAKGRVGEAASNLLGSLLLSHLQLVAMARSDQAEEERRPFFIHIDEFQSFSTDAFASLLSEARKFKAHFCLANQFLEQVSDSVRAAVLGNAGSLMVFRVSAADAQLLAPEFHPLPEHELAEQSPYRARLRRGDGDHRTIFVSPRPYGGRGRRDIVARQSRRNFGRAP
jgi:energy-coupling factor transporter ATP-binding protein EcfA2